MSAGAWWLSVFMFVNGGWIPGEKAEGGGWSPRAYESEKICLKRKASVEEMFSRMKAGGRHVTPTHWVCAKGKPMTEIDLPAPKKP